MATTYHNFEGTAYWAKVYEPDEYQGNTFWVIDLEMDANELARFKMLNTNNGIKPGENGGSVVRFRRPQWKVYGKMPDQKLVGFVPPEIYNADFTPIAIYHNDEGTKIRTFEDPKLKPTLVGEQTLIGNGSKVRVNVAAYDIMDGKKAVRLESITIKELVGYEPTAPVTKPDVPKEDGVVYNMPTTTGTEISDEIPF